MKKYIALKAVKFDKRYQKGEEVPENVIAPKMITKLERCGSIAVREIEEQEETENLPEEEQEEEPNENKEKELLQYKKEELEHMAEQKGIEIKQGMTKSDIVELLLQKE